MITGLVKLSDYGVNSSKTVFYGADGAMKYGQQFLNGHWYLFQNGEGQMLKGLQDLTEYGENKVVYYDPTNGMMQYGKVTVNGKALIFENGTGALQMGWFTDTSAGVTVNADGSKTTNRYYVEKSGPAVGERQINGKWYLFNTDGQMVTGKVKLSDYGVNNSKTVLYGNDGAMKYGQQLYNGSWYLFERGYGRMLTGLQNLKDYGENKSVYYDPLTGAMQYGVVSVDGKKLTFAANTGALKLGWYVDSERSSTANADGSETTNRFYVNDKGVVSGELLDNGKWYLFNHDGYMITGKVRLSDYGVPNSKTVLYGQDGVMRYGEQLYNGNWYLFERGYGRMVTGLTDLDSYGENKVVYYNADGTMSHTTATVNGKNYRFDGRTGAILDEDFFNINGGWYYTRAGSFARGQQYINGHWYLFSNSTKTVQYGLQDLSKYGEKKTVYYDPQMGWMLYGSRNINNGTYTFNNGDGRLSSVVLNHQWYSQLNQGVPEGCEAASLQIAMSVHGRWASLQDIYNATSYGYGVTPYNGFYGNPWGGGSSKIETVFPDAIVSKAQRVTARL